jgi:putative molybdopterin biosynthesis protein
MSVYLKDIPMEQAKTSFSNALRSAGLWGILGTELIQLDENSVGRILAEPVWAKISSPHYHASAMDGFAIHSTETIGAQPATPVILKIGTSARYLDTGDPLPDGFDAVIPIENTEALDSYNNQAQDIRNPYSIRVRASVVPWSHVRPLGEDFIATQLVLPAGHKLRPFDLGAIAASGHATVKVSRKPKVAILPTGSELVPIGSDLKSGDILEYNSLVLAAQLNAMGAEASRFSITRDNFEEICLRIKEAAKDFDLILLNAGSSAGSEDFSSRAIEQLGQLLVHGVAVRPGHPVIFGTIHSEKNREIEKNRVVPIVGVPGYPVSAALTVEIFVEPIIACWLGRPVLELQTVKAKLTRKIVSPPGDDDYVRVVMGRVDDILLAAPLSRGAGVISSLVKADGLVVIPRGEQGVEAGQQVTVNMYRPMNDVEKTIFCIGSHDMTLDLLSQSLAKFNRRFVSSNVGSQGGLLALGRHDAHLAGSHLLDPESGEFNVAYIQQYLPGVPIRLITLVRREQGLMVKKGNPLKISRLEDITRNDIRFINRQRGSGTRVLLDFHLKQDGLATESINGYDEEEYTHLGVAAAISSGRADTGLGIPAAAIALGLDFIPLFTERYDLVVPHQHLNSDLLEPLFNVISGADFKNSVSALQGYDVTEMGNVVADIKYSPTTP